MRFHTTVIPLAAAALLSAPACASAAFVHVVAPGESLTSIAAADGLSVEALAAANGIAPTTELVAGSGLVIPAQQEEVAGAEPGAITPSAEAGDGDYDNDDGAVPSSQASAAVSQPVGEAAQGAPGAPPYPTPETVSPEQVAEVAAADGVPASLANAIADQESGFNNELVSSADAVGVMQITPGTWRWINETMNGQAPLSPSSAVDNVRGGVSLLHSLLEATGGDEGLAAAGYFQGLPSVLQNGVYPSTQRYVEDVQALQQRFGGG
jgi:soluble lytic murein transglycosylase-like protein